MNTIVGIFLLVAAFWCGWVAADLGYRKRPITAALMFAYGVLLAFVGFALL